MVFEPVCKADQVANRISEKLSQACLPCKKHEKLEALKDAEVLVSRSPRCVTVQVRNAAFELLRQVVLDRPGKAIDSIKMFQLTDGQIAVLASDLIDARNWGGFRLIKKEFASVIEAGKDSIEATVYNCIVSARSFKEIKAVDRGYSLPRKDYDSAVESCLCRNLKAGDVDAALLIGAKLLSRLALPSEELAESIRECCLILAKSGRWHELERLGSEWGFDPFKQNYYDDLVAALRIGIASCLVRFEIDQVNQVAIRVGLTEHELQAEVKPAVLDLIRTGKFTAALLLARRFNLPSGMFRDNESQEIFRKALSDKQEAFPATVFCINQDCAAQTGPKGQEAPGMQQLADKLVALPTPLRADLLSLIDRIKDSTVEQTKETVDHFLSRWLCARREHSNETEWRDCLLELRFKLLQKDWTHQEVHLLRLLAEQQYIRLAAAGGDFLALFERAGLLAKSAGLGVQLCSLEDSMDFIISTAHRIKVGEFNRQAYELDLQLDLFREKLFTLLSVNQIVEYLSFSQMPSQLFDQLKDLLAECEKIAEKKTEWQRGYCYQRAYHKLSNFVADLMEIMVRRDSAFGGEYLADRYLGQLTGRLCELLAVQYRSQVSVQYWYHDLPLGYPLSQQLFERYLDLFAKTADPGCQGNHEVAERIEDFRLCCLKYFIRSRVPDNTLMVIERSIRRTATYLSDNLGVLSIYRRADMEGFSRAFPRKRLNNLFDSVASRFLREEKAKLSKSGKGDSSENGRLLVNFENRWGSWIKRVFQSLPEVSSLMGIELNDEVDAMPNQLQLFTEEKYFTEIKIAYKRFGEK